MFVLIGLNSNIAGKLAGGSFISKVLLANADALCAAASPLVEDDIPAYVYIEVKCTQRSNVSMCCKLSLC